MSESLLLKIARESIAEVFEAKNTINRQELLETYPVLNEHISSFVSIYLDNELRGSFGSIIPKRALLDDIIYNAKAAAFEDKRFSPLKTSEYLHSVLELSLLTPPSELNYDTLDDVKKSVKCGEDGMIITLDNKQAFLLPQSWSQAKDFDSFFDILLKKADLKSNDLDLHPKIFTFQVEQQRDNPILN